MPSHPSSILLQGLQLKHSQTASHRNQPVCTVPEEVKGAPKDGLIVKESAKDIWAFPGKLAGVLLSLISGFPMSVERG